MKKTTNNNQSTVSEEINNTNNQIEETTVEQQANPFSFSDNTVVNASSRKLDLTPILVSTAQTRANELVKATPSNPEWTSLATKMLDDLLVDDLIVLIETVIGTEQIKADAKLLAGADEDQLSRLLESRRSDRSKTKAKNPKSSMTVCLSYIACMYAELMVREAWNKPYQSNLTTEYGTYQSDDKSEITKKIKSLQSKQCRLGKIAKLGDAAAQKELDATVAEIARLNSLRGVAVKATSVVKDVKIDQLREILAKLDPSTMDEQALENYNQMMTLVG